MLKQQRTTSEQAATILLPNCLILDGTGSGDEVPRSEKSPINKGFLVRYVTRTDVHNRITNPRDGSKCPFPIMQAGEKGQLIAEWFEFTATSGTDIAVTSNLATMDPETQRLDASPRSLGTDAFFATDRSATRATQAAN
jgi:hypothetical protein